MTQLHDMTAGELHDRLMPLGADLMARALGALERGYYLALRGFMALSIEITDADVDGFVTVVADLMADGSLDA